MEHHFEQKVIEIDELYLKRYQAGIHNAETGTEQHMPQQGELITSFEERRRTRLVLQEGDSEQFDTVWTRARRQAQLAERHVQFDSRDQERGETESKLESSEERKKNFDVDAFIEDFRPSGFQPMQEWED